MALLESIDDPTPIMALAFIGFTNWYDAGEFGELLRWSQTVVDLAAGDPAKGAGFGIGSPLAVALTFRGVCSVVAGPSRVAPRPRRRRRDGPKQRPETLASVVSLGLRFRDAVRGASGR